MMVYSVNLIPKGAFHLGERGIGYEETAEMVHADTLFGALCTAWALLFGNDEMVNDLLPVDVDADAWTPPFLLSSAFPYAGSVRFYPRPLVPWFEESELSDDGGATSQNGNAKDVAWVSGGIMSQLLVGELPSPDEATLLHDGTVWLTNEELEELHGELGERCLWNVRLWKVGRSARVALDVPTDASVLWHFGRIAFHHGCGFHFHIRFLRDDIVDKFKATVRLLGDVGIGGDRSAGHGLFTPTFEESIPQRLNWLAPQPSTKFITISPVIPRVDQLKEMLSEGCRYRFIVRGGWIGSVRPMPYRRKAVRMLAEGALLIGSADKLYGKLADVTPEQLPPSAPLTHRIYRWGYAFPIAVQDAK